MNRARRLVTALLLTVMPHAGAADIYQWGDSDGVQHYTNLLAEVPPAQRDTMRVVVDERARRPPAESETATTGVPAPEPIPPRAAAATAERVAACEAYVDGLVRGIAVGRSLGTAPTDAVEINGPLAVAGVAIAQEPDWVVVPPYESLVTTAFDGGRSRHRTLRMLLQDQFAIDRGRAFVYPERFLPPYQHAPFWGGGNQFLPRGLPYGAPRHGRVFVR